MDENTLKSRKSRLDQHTDILGTKSDKDVAKLAGVSIENVRTYRIRRGIPAAWRGETVDHLQAKEAFRSRRRKQPKRSRRRKRMRPRASRLDPFAHLLGEVPDGELAHRAGVTPENVRSFRLRRGIPARWRGEDEASPEAATPASAPRRSAAPATKGARSPSTRQSGASNGGRFAFRVSTEVGGEPKDYVVFSSDMVEAAREAGVRLSRLHPGSVLREIALVGEAL